MSTHALKVLPDENDRRLDIFLTKNLADISSRSFVQKLIESGYVSVNGTIVKSKYKVQAGDRIQVDISEDFLTPEHLEPENIPLDIFYEDESLLIVNKASGLVVHPANGHYSGTLVNALLYYCKNLSDFNSALRAGIVHRLDRETSGLMVVAKDNKTHARLAKQFEEHVVYKKYVALVEGKIEFDEGKIEAPLGRHPVHHDKKIIDFEDELAKDALTFYRVMKRTKDATLVALFPKTGRTHQLRVHMAHIKHPILGDDKYGKRNSFSRLALHAQALGFIHPKNKKYVEFSSVVPKEFMDRVK